MFIVEISCVLRRGSDGRKSELAFVRRWSARPNRAGFLRMRRSINIRLQYGVRKIVEIQP